MQPKELDQILLKVAHKNHTTIQEVRNEIMIAMKEAQQNPDPNVQALWASIPKKGDAPTIEEFMEFLIHGVSAS
ncbi:MAG: hypothetical protein IJ375_03630 [Oscillospiraceae bacterium]|nr:hypothetical protein [Oscillospiraceae bacterium]